MSKYSVEENVFLFFLVELPIAMINLQGYRKGRGRKKKPGAVPFMKTFLEIIITLEKWWLVASVKNVLKNVLNNVLKNV